MAPPLKWLFEMTDRMSGPAKSLAKNLTGVTGEIEKSTKALRDFDQQAKKAQLGRTTDALTKTTDPLKRQRLEMQKMRLEESMRLSGLRQTKAALNGASAATGGWAARFAKLSPHLAAAAAIGTAVATGIVVPARAAMQQQQYQASFGTILRSRSAGDAAYERSVKFASDTPFDTTTVVDGVQRMLLAGFNTNESFKIMQGVGDVAALKGFDPQVIDRMTLAISQIKGKGRLQGEELLQLAEAGLNQGNVYENLAKLYKTTPDKVRKMQEKGLVDADTGIYAILQAIQQTYSGGGPLGTGMKNQQGSLGQLLQTLQSRPFDLMRNVSKDSSFAALTKGVKAFVDTLDPAGRIGKKTANMISGAFALLVGVVKPLSFLFLGLFEGFVDVFGPFLGFIGRLFGEVSEGGQAAEILRAIGYTLGIITGVLAIGAVAWGVYWAIAMWPATLVVAVILLVINTIRLLSEIDWAYLGEQMAAPFIALWEFVASLGSRLFGAAIEIGGAIVEGVVYGLKTSWSWLTDSVSGLGSSVIDQFKSVLGIASPSKVFAELGAFTVEGYEQGLTSAGASVPDTMADVGIRPDLQRGSGSSGSFGATTFNVNITVNGNADSSTIEQMQDMLSAWWAEKQERMALSSGAY